MTDCDAIIIGSGPNGLSCALKLVHAGWKVLLIERNAAVGGGMRSAEVALPGFVHDLYAGNLGRFSQSPLYQDLQTDFDGLGVEFLASDFPYASVYPGGRAVRANRDPGRMEERLAADLPGGDLSGWRELLSFYRSVGPKFLPLQRATMPSVEMVRHLARLCVAPLGAARLARMLLQSPGQLVDRHFVSDEMKGFIAA